MAWCPLATLTGKRLAFSALHPDVSDWQEIQNVDYEVRAGLSTSYAEKGWVADDIHSESASRTLDYACMLFVDHMLIPLITFFT